MLVKSVETGETLYAHNESQPFIPASGMKLVTMGASLHYLGPNYRFETRFLVDGPIVNGVVEGNLYVHGTGDPSLTRLEMDYIARSLWSAGLREVRGDIVLDDSFFDDQLRGPASYDNILKKGLPIQSALSYNFNLVELRARPGAPGSKAELRDEGYGYFDVLNRVTTASRGRPWLRVSKLRQDRVLVSGRVIQGDEEEHVGSFVAPDPTAYFASAFLGKIREQGVLALGQVEKGSIEGRKLETLYLHRSDRLVEVLAALGKFSNNFSAEQMLKTLGAHRFGAPGSFASGARAAGEYLVGLGFRREDFRIEDGSGLSYENRVSPRSLVAALRIGTGSFRYGPELLAALPIAAADGTLEKRAEGAANLVRAKTGLLTRVTGLSGLAQRADGRVVIFAVLVNGFRGDAEAAMHALDRFVAALVAVP